MMLCKLAETCELILGNCYLYPHKRQQVPPKPTKRLNGVTTQKSIFFTVTAATTLKNTKGNDASLSIYLTKVKFSGQHYPIIM
jgi:hypothetical protein